MKILLVVKQKKNIDTFRGAIECLLNRGHTVTVAVQERDEERDEKLVRDVGSAGFQVVRCPSARTDEWGRVAPLLRSLRDCVHYLKPELRGAVKLQTRTVQKLRQELASPVDSDVLAAGLRELPAPQVGRLDAVLRLAERSLPTDPIYDEFLASHAPDVLLASPVVHFGSAQADLVASARRLGIPLWMLLFSWDNLSTKGLLHRQPDLMFVWNEQQRQEAARLHGFPADRVVVVGAPRFDGFFELQPALTREDFHRPVGLDPTHPTLLYVCSSRFVSESELPFVRRWVAALRSSAAPALRNCNIVVRPHPDVALLDDERIEEVRWPALPELTAAVARPFGDDRAIVLRTKFRNYRGLYESIFHSAAVVGLNTSAELEAGIVGRPVYTILAGQEAADGQQGTLHFHYLLEEQGGFVSAAANLEEHERQLASCLGRPGDPTPIRTFIGTFLRPHGIDRPVAPILAESLEREFTRTRSAAREPDSFGNQASMPSVDDVPPGDASTDLDRLVTPSDAGGDVIALNHDGLRLHVYATPEVAVGRRKPHAVFDAATLRWLRAHVAIGDVVYDIGAGVGLYTLVAAKQRDALVVAFEAGYRSFAHLCDNILLNGCDGHVVPVPLALGEGDALRDLKYKPGAAGQYQYSVREPWRAKGSAGDRAYIQPALVTTLDALVDRYQLAPPKHVRFGVTTATPAVFAGAVATLTLPSVQTLFISVKRDVSERVLGQLNTLGWDADMEHAVSPSVVAIALRRARPFALEGSGDPRTSELPAAKPAV